MTTSTESLPATTASNLSVAETPRLPRCLHRSPAGRRCRQSVPFSTTLFCDRHAPFHSDLPVLDDLAPALLGDIPSIDTAQDAQEILSRLFVLLAQDRIPLKKASVLAYILQQLVRTLPLIEREQTSAPTHFINDLPRPDRTYKAPPSHPIFSTPIPTGDLA